VIKNLHLIVDHLNAFKFCYVWETTRLTLNWFTTVSSSFHQWYIDGSILPLFIKSILKSLVIFAIWLALSGAIFSRIALFFALNRIFFSASENGTVKQNNQSDFKVSLNKSIKFQENERQKVIVWRILQLLLPKLCCYRCFFPKQLTNLISYSFWMTIMSFIRLKTYFNGSF